MGGAQSPGASFNFSPGGDFLLQGIFPTQGRSQVGIFPTHTSCWQPTLVLLPGKSHGHRILAGYSPWGLKESDTTEQLSMRMRLLLSTYLGKRHQ